jgi:hypothetical protein
VYILALSVVEAGKLRRTRPQETFTLRLEGTREKVQCERTVLSTWLTDLTFGAHCSNPLHNSVFQCGAECVTTLVVPLQDESDEVCVPGDAPLPLSLPSPFTPPALSRGLLGGFLRPLRGPA